MSKGGPSALRDGPISSHSPIAVIEDGDEEEVIEILDDNNNDNDNGDP